MGNASLHDESHLKHYGEVGNLVLGYGASVVSSEWQCRLLRQCVGEGVGAACFCKLGVCDFDAIAHAYIKCNEMVSQHKAQTQIIAEVDAVHIVDGIEHRIDETLDILRDNEVPIKSECVVAHDTAGNEGSYELDLAFGIVERDVVFFQLFYNDVRAMSVMLRALPGVSPGDVLYDVATVAACA